ncbi:MAG: alpha/beta fold hydrolase, partial [bacterium]
MLSSLYEHTLSIDDDRMTYIKFGHGKKNLVLISGLSLRSIHGSGLILLWMYRLFIKDYTVYIFEPKETIPLDYTIDQ